jgi:NADH-quinone oxidoreductase subunit G
MSFFNPTFEWNFFFKQIDIKEKSKARILILVNDELDIESLNVIKNLANHSQKSVTVRAISNNAFENKTYDSYFKNKISNIEKPSRFCFLLSSNTRLESAILNVKLRAKYLARNISVVCLGINSNLNLPTEYVNLNLSKILSFFEGKNFKLSKFFLISKDPLFFFGSSFKNRFSKVNLLVSHLKKFMPSSVIFMLEESSNSSGLRLMNIKSLNNKDFDNSEILISINLKDVLFSRNFLNPDKIVESFWLNLHTPEIAFKYDMVVPVNSYYETGGTFVNLEGRPQKTMRLGSKTGFLRSVKSIFTAIKNDAIETQKSFLNYVKEITEDSKQFSLLKNNFVGFNNAPSINLVSKINLYPSKSSIEDFYTKDLLCKKSLTMLARSQEIRKSLTNFS